MPATVTAATASALPEYCDITRPIRDEIVAATPAYDVVGMIPAQWRFAVDVVARCRANIDWQCERRVFTVRREDMKAKLKAYHLTWARAANSFPHTWYETSEDENVVLIRIPEKPASIQRVSAEAPLTRFTMSAG